MRQVLAIGHFEFRNTHSFGTSLPPESHFQGGEKIVASIRGLSPSFLGSHNHRRLVESLEYIRDKRVTCCKSPVWNRRTSVSWVRHHVVEGRLLLGAGAA